MNDLIALSRSPSITRSAYVCALFALMPLAYGVHAIAHDESPGYRSMAAFAISASGVVCAILLLKLNRFARPAFACFWISLVIAASYSWVVVRASYDYRGLLGIGALAFCGLGVWGAINDSWPRSVARLNNSPERAREG